MNDPARLYILYQNQKFTDQRNNMETKLNISYIHPVATMQEKLSQAITSRTFLLVVVFARPLLLFCAHLIFAGVFVILGDITPFQTAGSYWSVYGTLADVGCLLLLHYGMRREGKRITDLFAFDKSKLLKDILRGLGIFLAGGVILILGSKLAGIVAYNSFSPVFPVGAYIRELPFWAVIYSRFIWWVIWSATEELTYNGYSLPRLQAAFGSKWKALMLVSFSWSLMHCFLPFINLQHALYMFILFIPLTLFLGIMYFVFKRLTPLIAGHWLMDLGNVFFMTTILP
jgi:hypothetical protein